MEEKREEREEIKFEELSPEEIHELLEKLYPEIYRDFKEKTRSIKDKLQDYAEFLAYTIANVFAVIFMILARQLFVIIGDAEAVKEKAFQDANEIIRPHIADPVSLIQAYRKGAIGEDDFIKCMHRLGYDNDQIEVMLSAVKRNLEVGEILEAYRRGEMDEEEAEGKLFELGLSEYEVGILLSISRRLLDKTELIACWLRGLISEDEFEIRLKQHGYDYDDIQKIKQLAFYIPSVSDLIELVVKEAFNEEKIRRLGLDANVDEVVEKVGRYAKAQGLSEEWLKRFWYAHWKLPSVEQGINMYFRGLITYDDLKELIVALDYPPFWVDKLLGLAINIPTRVDLRRFLENGLADFDYVVEQYRKLGYTEEDAVRLAKLAFFEVTSEERNKLRNTILKGFKHGWIDEDEAREMLKEIYIPQDVIEFLIQNVKLERQDEQIEAELKVVRDNYLKGNISESEMFRRLITLGLRSKEAEYYRYIWSKEKEARQRRLTRYDLDRLARYNLIDKDRYVEKMQQIGYAKEDAELLYELTQVHKRS